MATLVGRIWDQAAGRPLAARVQVLDSTGRTCAPADSIHKHGPGEPFFYADGSFAVDVTRGQVDIAVERGTEYRPIHQSIVAARHGTVELDLPLVRWTKLAEHGWYAGNTHVHYDEKETRALDRLQLDPRVEDLPVFVVSVLKRRELAYASNDFPIGRHALSTPEHTIDVGEESRHNREPWTIGYGHIMLINIRELVEPMSRGVLVDDASPDYPPLIDACDEARRQGGVVLWCHNAQGMEAPIAAVLGRLDGINLFDPWWADPEYEIWYRLLNCGLRLPASTGSDWFLCSSNRVYTDVGADFSYERWLGALQAGRSFITNGPVLRMTVDGQAPSNDLLDLSALAGSASRTAEIVVEWEGTQPVDRVELVRDGEVAFAFNNVPEAHQHVDQPLSGGFTTTLDVSEAGWVAARAWGSRRNTYAHPLWAHTSPVYLRERPAQATVRAASTDFLEQIERSRDWITTRARFDNAAQHDRLLQLYAEGRAAYERLARG
jgi:hypothetical protein